MSSRRGVAVIDTRLYAVQIGSRFLDRAGRLDRAPNGLTLGEAAEHLVARGDEAATLVPFDQVGRGPFRTALTLIIGEAVPNEEPAPAEED
jgi:hypothetical protein